MSGKKGAKHFTAIAIAKIEKMNQEGKTHREIAETLGMERRQVKAYFNRKYRKDRKIAVGVSPRPKGRPRKNPETAESRIKELEREVELLRSFLHAAGRM